MPSPCLLSDEALDDEGIPAQTMITYHKQSKRETRQQHTRAEDSRTVAFGKPKAVLQPEFAGALGVWCFLQNVAQAELGS